MRGLLRWLEAGFLLISALALGYSSYSWIVAHLFQSRAHRLVNQLMQAPGKPGPPAPGAEGALLGEIQIPRIGVSSVILEGTDESTLRKAVCHIAGTALPGQAGNIAIAGHRDTFFRPLRRIAIGDEVLISSPAGRFAYRVQSVQVVGPEDAQVLDRTTRDTVTLVTCYPFSFVGAAPKRFIVQATRVVGGTTTELPHARHASPGRQLSTSSAVENSL
jgi:sortase A